MQPYDPGPAVREMAVQAFVAGMHAAREDRVKLCLRKAGHWLNRSESYRSAGATLLTFDPQKLRAARLQLAAAYRSQAWTAAAMGDAHSALAAFVSALREEQILTGRRAPSWGIDAEPVS